MRRRAYSTPSYYAHPFVRTGLLACLLALAPNTLAGQQADLPMDGGLEFANYAHTCDRVIPLPEPTGQFEVGTVTYHWVDRSRPEERSPDGHDHRQLIATLFYPALRVPDGPPAPYFPGLDLLRAGFATDGREMPQQIAEELAVRDCVLTHAFANRPVDGSEDRYPIVLISPGGNVSRHSHTALAQELASHGWIVAVLSHAYSGWDIFPEGGHVMSSDYWNAPEDASEAERARLSDELASMLAADATFTLDQLFNLSSHDPHGRFEGRLDTTEVGIVGHSRGGSTVGRACSSDGRFDACVILDNIGPDPELETGLGKPQLSIRRPWTGEREQRLHAFLRRNDTVAFDAVVDGTVHMSFTDLPLIEPARHGSAIEPERAHEIVSALTLAFLEQYVREQTGRPAGGLPVFPEVVVRRYGPAAPEIDSREDSSADGHRLARRMDAGHRGTPSGRVEPRRIRPSPRGETGVLWMGPGIPKSRQKSRHVRRWRSTRTMRHR